MTKETVDELIKDLVEKYALPKRKSIRYDEIIISTAKLKKEIVYVFDDYDKYIELNELIRLFKSLYSYEKEKLVNLPGLPQEIYRMFLKEKGFNIGFQALLSVDLIDYEWRSLWDDLRFSHKEKDRDFSSFESKQWFNLFANSNACPVDILKEYSDSLKGIRLRKCPSDEKHYYSYIQDSRKKVAINLKKNRPHKTLSRKKPKNFTPTVTEKFPTKKSEKLPNISTILLNEIDTLGSETIFANQIRLRLNSNHLDGIYRFHSGKSWDKKHISLPQFEYLPDASKLAIMFGRQTKHYELVTRLLETEMLDDYRTKQLLNFDHPDIYRNWCHHELFPNHKLHELLSMSWDKEGDYDSCKVKERIALKPNVPHEILDIILFDDDLDICKAVLNNKNISQTYRAREWNDVDNNSLIQLKTKISALISMQEADDTPSIESLISKYDFDRLSAEEVFATFEQHKSLFTKYDFINGSFDCLLNSYEDLLTLAQNFSTPECLLGLLVQARTKHNNFCYYYIVLSWVLRNPNATPSLVSLLADKIIEFENAQIELVKDHESLDAFKRRKRRASQEELDAYNNHEFMFYPGKDANKALLSRDPYGVLLALCSNSKLDPKRLKTLSKSKDYLIRGAVARNESTPKEVLINMQSDPHPLVSKFATEALNQITT